MTNLTDLIQQLIAADEWPAPHRLQTILDLGEAAIVASDAAGTDLRLRHKVAGVLRH